MVPAGFPLFLGCLLVGGVKGYSTGNPKARLRGNWGHIGELGLLTLVGMTAFSLLTSKAALHVS
ncbi:hypothetical protein ABBQ38_001502 [Trebouxia sp. C0009 RCD-2024]